MKFQFDVEYKTVDATTLGHQNKEFRYLKFTLNQVGEGQSTVCATFNLQKRDIEWILESDV